MPIIHYDNILQIYFYIFYDVPRIFHYFIAYQKIPFYLKCFLKYTRSGFPKVNNQWVWTMKSLKYELFTIDVQDLDNDLH
jgi:hypothetical protein